MNLKRIFHVCFISFILCISCNKRGDRENPLIYEEIKNEVKSNSNLFEFGIYIKALDDYQYILYYKDGSNDWYEENKTIWTSANGGEIVKNVSFIFPNNIIPKSMRFDIGLNEYKLNQPVKIFGGYVKYSEKTINFNANQFRRYFKPNEFIVYDSVSDEFNFKVNNDNKFDPIFESTSSIDSLLSIIKL